MAKPARGKNGHRASPPASLDDSVGTLMELADSDSSNRRRPAVEDGEPARDDRRAMGDRDAYERLRGKPQPKRRDLQQADERASLRDDPEDDEPQEQEIDPESEGETDPEDLEDEGEEGEAAEARPTRRRGQELDRALQALRRVKAPAWVFQQREERILELAESLGDFQRNTDDAIRRRDETIGALSQAIGGKGARATADEENPTQGNVADDLEESATALARAMGLESDPVAKKALVDFGQKARGQSGAALAKQVGELRSALRTMVVDRATRAFRRRYPEHASDTDAQARFVKSFGEHAQLERYSNDFGRLVRASAHAEFGPPKKRTGDRNGDAPRRNAGAPTMHTRAERAPRVLDEGTESHDRAVYSSVMKKERGRFAVRR